MIHQAPQPALNESATMNKPLTINSRDYQHGYTLIEILIAVVIISIGLLGMAGIQLKGMRGTQNSFLQTEAATLANNIAERMHANPNGSLYAGINSTSYDCDTPPTTPKKCDRQSDGTVDSCSAADMATFDIDTWLCGTPGVKNSLPNGSASVTCIDNNTTDSIACSPGSTMHISLNWTATNPSADTKQSTNDEVVTQSLAINTVP